MGRKWLSSLPIILFFGALWGLVEVGVGGVLYAADIRGVASPVLGVLAFAILAAARTRCDLPGSSTAIAGFAILYKGLVTLFICHLAAIALLGVAFDLVWSVTRARRPWLVGLVGTYLGFALFAALMTLVVQSGWWNAAKAARHILVSGSIAAVVSALVLPVVLLGMRRLRIQSDQVVAWGSVGALLLWAGALLHGLL